VCVVYASRHQYEEKIRNTAWRGPYIIRDYWKNRKNVTKKKLNLVVVILTTITSHNLLGMYKPF